MVKKLSHQPLVGLGIAAALHQHVENETILIDSPPKPAFFPPIATTTSSR
jgi:hypothetical protein